jgi:NAD(P)H-hydrate epimerase
VKLLSASQIQLWDAYTIQHEPISSLDLMERAGTACTRWILEHVPATTPIKIFCGKGNNGGDGLVIARQLVEAGRDVWVYILEFGAKGTDDFQVNLQRLHPLTTQIHFIQPITPLPVLLSTDCVVDALFGSGLNRPLKDTSATLVQHINESNSEVVAIDVPSGMYIDHSAKGHTIVRATHTLTFQSLKLCFMAAENAPYFGEVHVLPIGLHQAFPGQADTPWEMMSPGLIRSLYKPRSSFSHKGTYGHALLVTGNKGKMGASVLATRACLRSGIGLLTVNTPEWGYPILQTAVAEAMTTPREQQAPDLSKYTVIGMGPGLGTENDTAALVKYVLEQAGKPLVLDADALNIISRHPEWLGDIPADSILSPHPKEFDRLFGAHSNDFDRMHKALECSLQYPLVIILKGHHTLVCYQGKGYFNTTGNAGMATGGSGDVLTGILTALLAQPYTCLQAALLGVYLHGRAADLALEQQSMESLLPGDIIDYLGRAFTSL